MAFVFPASGVLHSSDLNYYLSDSGWLAATGLYAANWSDYGSGAEPGRYRKLGRYVYLGGLVLCSAAIAANTTTTIFTLPTGYRPAVYTVGWTAICGVSIAGKIQVLTTGQVQWTSGTAIGSGQGYTINGYFAVD